MHRQWLEQPLLQKCIELDVGLTLQHFLYRRIDCILIGKLFALFCDQRNLFQAGYDAVQVETVFH